MAEDHSGKHRFIRKMPLKNLPVGGGPLGRRKRRQKALEAKRPSNPRRHPEGGLSVAAQLGGMARAHHRHQRLTGGDVCGQGSQFIPDMGQQKALWGGENGGKRPWRPSGQSNPRRHPEGGLSVAAQLGGMARAHHRHQRLTGGDVCGQGSQFIPDMGQQKALWGGENGGKRPWRPGGQSNPRRHPEGGLSVAAQLGGMARAHHRHQRLTGGDVCGQGSQFIPDMGQQKALWGGENGGKRPWRPGGQSNPRRHPEGGLSVAAQLGGMARAHHRHQRLTGGDVCGQGSQFIPDMGQQKALWGGENGGKRPWRPSGQSNPRRHPEGGLSVAAQLGGMARAHHRHQRLTGGDVCGQGSQFIPDMGQQKALWGGENGGKRPWRPGGQSNPRRHPEGGLSVAAQLGGMARAHHRHQRLTGGDVCGQGSQFIPDMGQQKALWGGENGGKRPWRPSGQATPGATLKAAFQWLRNSAAWRARTIGIRG